MTHVLLTHGHSDHISDAAADAEALRAQCSSPISRSACIWSARACRTDKINPGNTGGTVDCGGFTTTFVQALHSSSFGTSGGNNVYLGNPLGLVLHFPEEKTLYQWATPTSSPTWR